MKPLRMKLQDECSIRNTQLNIIEKDYALSYILAGISKQNDLANSLVFKGGTALKKMYFGDYRFSVDLDFSTINAPKNHDLENAIQDAIIMSTNLLDNYGPFDIRLKRYPERNPHPTGQEAFNVFVKFPWHREALCTIKIEITHDEPVILTPESRPIIHGYNEAFDFHILCYHIEEIIAEKLRALLQTHKKLINRGWNRPRARDYYDLWAILKHYSSSIDHNRLNSILDQKCKHRDVSYLTIDDFFTPELINEACQHWESTVENLINDAPNCDTVLSEAKSILEGVLGSVYISLG